MNHKHLYTYKHKSKNLKILTQRDPDNEQLCNTTNITPAIVSTHPENKHCSCIIFLPHNNSSQLYENTHGNIKQSPTTHSTALMTHAPLSLCLHRILIMPLTTAIIQTHTHAHNLQLSKTLQPTLSSQTPIISAPICPQTPGK